MVNKTFQGGISESDAIYESQFSYSEQAGTILDQFTIDVRKFSSWNDVIEVTKKALLVQGAVILENTQLDDLANLYDMCKSFGESMDYIGGTNDRADHGMGVLNVGTEPPFANVSAHNEMSYSNRYPEIFVIGCKLAPKDSGFTVIGDNKAITQELLQTDFGEKLRVRGLRYIRNFHDEDNPESSEASLLSWQQAFGTNNRDEAIAKARVVLGGHSACDVNVTKNGVFHVTYHAAAFEYDPDLQEDVCFASIGNHGYWFRQWAPYNQVPHIERPWHMQFGDGEELSEEELSLFAKISNHHGYPVYWKPGKIALLNNRLFTHGRPPYTLAENEKRQLGVLLLSPTERNGQTI